MHEQDKQNTYSAGSRAIAAIVFLMAILLFGCGAHGPPNAAVCETHIDTVSTRLVPHSREGSECGAVRKESQVVQGGLLAPAVSRMNTVSAVAAFIGNDDTVTDTEPEPAWAAGSAQETAASESAAPNPDITSGSVSSAPAEDDETEPVAEETPGFDDFTVPDEPPEEQAFPESPDDEFAQDDDVSGDAVPEAEPQPEQPAEKESAMETDLFQDSAEPAAVGDTDVMQDDEPYVEFVNEPNVDIGGLSVTKHVAGISGDRQKEFPFTVTLSDTSVSGMYGDMAFMEGKASFTLKDGETKTADGLSAGITYTVEETSSAGYTVTKTGDTGAIVAESVQSCTFTNTLDSIVLPSTGGPGMSIVLICAAGLAALTVTAKAMHSSAAFGAGTTGCGDSAANCEARTLALSQPKRKGRKYSQR